MANDSVGVAAAGTPTNYIDNESISTGGSPATVDRQRVRLGGVAYTDLADVVTGDTGQGALAVVGTRKEVTFTTATAQASTAVDLSNYRWISVHITGQGTSSSMTFQGSNDSTNWVSIGLVTAAAGSPPVSSTTSASVIVTGPASFRYFRLNVTGISAGTTSAVMEFFAVSPSALASGMSTTNTPATPTASNTTSAASTNATSVKNTSATLFGLVLTNYTASSKYFKLYNKASAPTVGTDVPIATFDIPANTYRREEFGPMGIRLGTGLAFAITGAQADTDTTAVAAGDVKAILAYL